MKHEIHKTPEERQADGIANNNQLLNQISLKTDVTNAVVSRVNSGIQNVGNSIGGALSELSKKTDQTNELLQARPEVQKVEIDGLISFLSHVKTFEGAKGDTGEKGDPGQKGETGANGMPGRDGKDGAPGKDGLDADPEAVVDLLNTKFNVLDFKVLKNVPDFQKSGQHQMGEGGGASLLSRLTDVSITSPANGDALVYNSTTGKWTNGTGSTGSWSTTGNSGLSASTNFIGNTDAVDLVFRRDNTEYARLTTQGTNKSFSVERLLQVNTNQTGTSQYYVYQDNGSFGTWNGTNFNTGNPARYSSLKDILVITHLGESSGENSDGFSIVGIAAPVDTGPTNSTVNPRESTLTLTRTSTNSTASVGSRQFSEGIELYNNKYSGEPYGSGKTFGIGMFKTGYPDGSFNSYYREFKIRYYQAALFTANPPTSFDTYATDIMRIFPVSEVVDVGDPTDSERVTYAQMLLPNTHLDVMDNHAISLYETNANSATATFNAATNVNTTTDIITVSSTANMYTGAKIFFTNQSTAITADIDNRQSTSDTYGTIANRGTHYTNFYFAIVVSGTQIRVATTYDDAMNGRYADLITAGVGSATIEIPQRIKIKAPAALSTNLDFVLPSTAGTAGYFLKTDGAGNTSWDAVVSGITIGDTVTSGTDTRVLFINGTVLAQSANFTFNTSTNLLSLGATGSVSALNLQLGGTSGTGLYAASQAAYIATRSVARVGFGVATGAGQYGSIFGKVTDYSSAAYGSAETMAILVDDSIVTNPSWVQNVAASSNASFAPTYLFSRSRGSLASPTSTSDGDIIANLQFNGFTSGGVQSAYLRVIQDGSTGGNAPTKFVLYTNAGSGSPVARFVIDKNGDTLPASDGSYKLGNGTLNWLALYLSSNSTINFNNGDVVLTHSSNTLTLTGGTLVVPSAGITVGSGTISLSGNLTTSGANALTITTVGTTSIGLPLSGYVQSAVYHSTATTGNSAGAETDIYSYTLPANTIQSGGTECIHIRAALGFGSGVSADKRIRAYLNGQLIYDSGAVSTVSASNSIDGYIFYTSSTSAKVDFIRINSVSGDSNDQNSGTAITSLDFTASQVLKITGSGTNANDVAGRACVFEIM